MPTNKPRPRMTESTDAEVAGAVRALERHGRRLTELLYRVDNGWHVLSYRALWGEVEADGRILVTKSYERFATLFGSLCRARSFVNVRRKPAGVETTKHGSNGLVKRTDRKRMG